VRGRSQTSGWSCGDIGSAGILGTPVIDTAANRIYVAAEIAASGSSPPTYHLFGLDIGNSGNGNPYYGWVAGVPTPGGTTNIFRTPSTGESTWAAGGVVVDDSSHNVFFATGNAIGAAASWPSIWEFRTCGSLGSGRGPASSHIVSNATWPPTIPTSRPRQPTLSVSM